MARQLPITRFLDSLTRLITSNPVIKHRPLNAVTFNNWSNPGKINQIEMRRCDTDTCKGYLTVNDKEIPLTSKGTVIKFGESPGVEFDISQRLEIEHFLNAVNV